MWHQRAPADASRDRCADHWCVPSLEGLNRGAGNAELGGDRGVSWDGKTTKRKKVTRSKLGAGEHGGGLFLLVCRAGPLKHDGRRWIADAGGALREIVGATKRVM